MGKYRFCQDSEDNLAERLFAEMFLERGWVFIHEAVRDWEARYK
jgi:hypothetical protein